LARCDSFTVVVSPLSVPCPFSRCNRFVTKTWSKVTDVQQGRKVDVSRLGRDGSHSCDPPLSARPCRAGRGGGRDGRGAASAVGRAARSSVTHRTHLPPRCDGRHSGCLG